MRFEVLLSMLGLGVMVWRLWPQPLHRPLPTPMRRPKQAEHQDGRNKKVSLIVPCRNEERNIPLLLKSLQNHHSNCEIIVVDDASNDKTVEVASQFEGVQVLQAGPKPPEWVGKSWACWAGAQAAKGDYLLFTDADTLHRALSLETAAAFMARTNADLITAPPFHRCEQRFEQALGLFHLFSLIATAYQARPEAHRVYAIGQYMMFRKESYFALGGHEAIKTSLVDDIDLARLTIEKGFHHSVYPFADLYEVQMYQTPEAFWNGWTRLLRLGMKRSSVGAFVELYLVFHIFVHPNWVWIPAWFFLGWVQSQHGTFSPWGVALAPLNVILFIAMSLVGFVQTLLKQKVKWHERVYLES